MPFLHPFLDLCFLISVAIIWLMIVYQLILTFAGYRYRARLLAEQERMESGDQQLKPVSVMIPARDEEVTTFPPENLQ